MSLITPTLIEHVYTMLRSTPPFKRWKLPEADDVRITITKSKEKCGEYCYEVDGTHHLLISGELHETIMSVTPTVAHEMIHLYEVLKEMRPDVKHGKFFQRCADQICKHHKFDRKTF